MPSPSSTRLAPSGKQAAAHKSPNAFMLFRSFFVAHPYLLPPDAIRQKDVSQYVGWVWQELPESAKQEWYQKAMDEKFQRQAGSAPSTSTQTSPSYPHIASSSNSSSSYSTSSDSLRSTPDTSSLPYDFPDMTPAEVQAMYDEIMRSIPRK